MPATPAQLHQLWRINGKAADGAEISLAGQNFGRGRKTIGRLLAFCLMIHSAVTIFSV